MTTDLMTITCKGCGFGVLLQKTGKMSFRRCPVCTNTIRFDKKYMLVVQGDDAE